MDFLCVSACFFPFEAESAFITGMRFECKTVKIKKKYIYWSAYLVKIPT